MVIENIIQTIMHLNCKIQTNNNCAEIGCDTHTIIRFRLCNAYKKNYVNTLLPMEIFDIHLHPSNCKC